MDNFEDIVKTLPFPSKFKTYKIGDYVPPSPTIPKRKNVHTGLGIFDSVRAAAAYHNISPSLVCWRLKSTNEQWAEWYRIDK